MGVENANTSCLEIDIQEFNRNGIQLINVTNKYLYFN